MSNKYNYINLEKTCIDYITCLFWIKDCYFNGIVNNWIYKNIFSPLLSQMYIVLKNNMDIFDNFKYSINTIDYKLLSPSCQFILTFPYDNLDDDNKYYESFTYDKELINNIKNKIKSLYLINNSFY